MNTAVVVATLLMALASLGATLLLSRRAPVGGADFVTALLRLGQALPLPVGILYEIGGWWSGPIAVALGVAAGTLGAPLLGRAAFPFGVFVLMVGKSYMATILFRGGIP